MMLPKPDAEMKGMKKITFGFSKVNLNGVNNSSLLSKDQFKDAIGTVGVQYIIYTTWVITRKV